MSPPPESVLRCTLEMTLTAHLPKRPEPSALYIERIDILLILSVMSYRFSEI